MSSHQVDILLISICNTEKPRRGRSLSTTASHIMFSVTCTFTFTTTTLTPPLFCLPVRFLLFCIQRFAVPHLPPELGQRALAAILSELGMMMICREKNMLTRKRRSPNTFQRGKKRVQNVVPMENQLTPPNALQPSA